MAPRLRGATSTKRLDTARMRNLGVGKYGEERKGFASTKKERN